MYVGLIQIQKAFPNDSLGIQFIDEICLLFNDPEQEVRLLALKNIAYLADCISPENALNKLIPLFKEIADSDDIEAKRKKLIIRRISSFHS
jgi:hypothetical protein